MLDLVLGKHWSHSLLCMKNFLSPIQWPQTDFPEHPMRHVAHLFWASVVYPCWWSPLWKPQAVGWARFAAVYSYSVHAYWEMGLTRQFFPLWISDIPWQRKIPNWSVFPLRTRFSLTHYCILMPTSGKKMAENDAGVWFGPVPTRGMPGGGMDTKGNLLLNCKWRHFIASWAICSSFCTCIRKALYFNIVCFHPNILVTDFLFKLLERPLIEGQGMSSFKLGDTLILLYSLKTKEEVRRKNLFGTASLFNC